MASACILRARRSRFLRTSLFSSSVSEFHHSASSRSRSVRAALAASIDCWRRSSKVPRFLACPMVSVSFVLAAQPTNKTWMADGDKLSRRVRAAARRAITFCVGKKFARMNELIKLRSTFEKRAKDPGGLFLLCWSDALDYVETRNQNRAFVSLGVEGFRITAEGAYQPTQDYSNDIADTSLDASTFIEETKAVIQRGRGESIWFEITFEDPNQSNKSRHSNHN